MEKMMWSNEQEADTADLPVLPEVTCPAASWTVSVIADTVDHDRIVFHQSILLSDIVPQQILRK